MKNSLRNFGSVPILAFALSLSTATAADGAKPATAPQPPTEKKSLRVITATEDTGPRDVLRPGTRVFVGRAGAMEKEMVTFLGVETSPASATLAAQLGLPKGAGLVVNQIVPDSPAIGALQPHDVLLKFEDQLLIEQRQLSVLIRNRQEGDEVTLTIVRAGKQTTAKVKLAKKEVPKVSAAIAHPFGDGDMLKLGAGGPGGNFNWRTAPGLPFDRDEADLVLGMIERRHGEPFTLHMDRPHGSGSRSVNINPGNSSIVFSDDDGALDLTMKDGKKNLVAKNAKGEQVFAGPVNTPAEREAMPAAVRERLVRLESMHDITFRTDGDFKSETKVIRPLGRGISLPLPPEAPKPRHSVRF